MRSGLSSEDLSCTLESDWLIWKKIACNVRSIQYRSQVACRNSLMASLSGKRSGGERHVDGDRRQSKKKRENGPLLSRGFCTSQLASFRSSSARTIYVLEKSL